MRLLILTVLLTVSLSVSAQITPNSQWTWISGDSTANQNGVYGILGTADPANKPGGRNGSLSWTDGAGNFWMFGGFGLDVRGSGQPYLNDLWEYNPPSNQWTWMNGDSLNGVQGIYGTQGVAAATNFPGGRAQGVSWIDAAGNLWLFGGYGYDDGTLGYADELNDLWKYDPSINQWTWMKGNSIAAQNGIYGIKGTAAAANTPGGRQGAVSWIDGSGNLWLYGGVGYDNIANFDDLNDLWKYDPTINQWTWVNGDSTVTKFGVYGTQGIADVANKPGGRDASVSWIDGTGNLWLFGGEGYTASAYGNLNDLWEYNPASDQWTWMKGDNTQNQVGVYGTQGVAANTNNPGARWGSISWTYANTLWLFGGDNTSGGSDATLNDLWQYNTSTNQWTWIKGDNTTNQVGIYGTLGSAGLPNKPGSRQGSVSWIDGAGNLWLSSGQGYPAKDTAGYLNDIWTLSKNGFVWIGVTSTDWTVGSNWSGGVVPGPTDDAIVPGGTPWSAEILNGVNTSCRSVQIITGAQVTVKPNGQLNIMH